MQERLLDFKKKAGAVANKIFDSILDIPPTYEVAIANFPHAKSCSRTQPVTRMEVEEYINFHGAGGWGVERSSIPLLQKYIVCSECHREQKYSG